ncbi:regulator of G-protein signaling 9a [Anarrhichthys ocellatus]|uniref:regulator of G-protein signaling 9a n=1 Tax=Anarrhichthys ocellatus TaxID=433405 RepID=UPI0012ED851E|nr:regulator of G-protein signaling 9-like [Anarrhichthys ocellatus]
MTIRTVRPNRVQHFRPRTHCFKKLEAIVVDMQDPNSGVKGSEQKLNVNTIPHVITGKDVIAWITTKMKTTPEEVQAIGTMLVAYGYIYPLQNHKKLVMCNDTSLYRFQTPYFWPTQKWVAEDSDYAIYLAKRNIRKKGMLEPYEQPSKGPRLCTTYPSAPPTPQVPLPKLIRGPCLSKQTVPMVTLCILVSQKITFDAYRRMNLFYQQAIMRSKVKSSVSLGALAKYVTTYKNHDPFLAPCLPSNPWQTDNDAYWTYNTRRVNVPTKMRVERWSFSLFELLNDLRGRDDFKIFLKKEFSGENLAFWEAAEELKWGTASSMSSKAETIFKTFLVPGAPRWINIDGRTMGLTVKGLDHPHRYVLEAAQTHVFLLMKKDTFFRYLKSPVYKDIQKKALNPESHSFSPAQLEQNAQNRSLGIHPIILWQQEEEEKAKAAIASAPVDVKAMMSKIDRKK